jgi:hypothetical protein
VAKSVWGLRSHQARRSHAHSRHWPILERLEDRTVLSGVTYTVNSILDDGSAGTLRWAITQANTVTPGARNTIQFSLPSPSTIKLESALPSLMAATIAIEGPGASSLTVERDPILPSSNPFGVFVVNTGVTAAISGLTIAHGLADFGGGVFNGGTVTLTNSTLATNSASYGGGIYNADTATLTNCTLAANSADYGGGIDNPGTVTLTNCTLAANSADYFGGGINNSGTVTLTNSTLATNSASYGGGVFNGGTVTLTNSTLATNSADGYGGGIDNAGTVTVANTIIAGNTAGSDGPDVFFQAVTSQGYNLIGNPSGGSGFIGTDLLSVNPLLGSLQDNGGPTQTMALLPGSPAIDAADAASAPANDQRGMARPQGSAPDIGAFESRGFTISVTGGDGQSTPLNAPFAQPLEVTVASHYGELVAGGVVTFTTPSSGASAILSSNTATIGPGGLASITATANTTAGTYNVTASAAGAAGPTSFTLTNLYQPVFSGLTDQSITYGTTSVRFSGTLAAGSHVPAGEDAKVTLNGVAQDTLIAPDGSFSTTFNTAALGVAATPYTVTYVCQAHGSFLGADGTSRLIVNPALLTITANSTSKTYGATVTFAGNEFTPTGLVNNDTVTSVTLTSAGAAAAATATTPGPDYGIVPSAAVGTGLGNYTIAYVNGNLHVHAKTLTITANSTSKTYGATVTFAGNEFSAEGLVNNDTVTGVTLTSAGAAPTAPVTGSPYDINPSAAIGSGLNNYSVSYHVGHLAVNAKALDITADDRTKTYGDTVAFAGTEFTASGLVNNDRVGTVILVSASAAASVHVAGSPYVIVPSGAAGIGLSNYSIAYHPGRLTVIPAPLTIVADNKVASFGGAVPALTASYFGFVNGDTPAGLATAVQLTTTATSNSQAGAYPITLGGGSWADYTIQFVNGTLTVSPYVPPARPRDRAAAAFITTLYNEILGRGPEPLEFQQGVSRYLKAASPLSIMHGLARSSELRALIQQGRAPGIPLRVAYNDSLRAARRAAARQPPASPWDRWRG